MQRLQHHMEERGQPLRLLIGCSSTPGELSPLSTAAKGQQGRREGWHTGAAWEINAHVLLWPGPRNAANLIQPKTSQPWGSFILPLC